MAEYPLKLEPQLAGSGASWTVRFVYSQSLTPRAFGRPLNQHCSGVMFANASEGELAIPTVTT